MEVVVKKVEDWCSSGAVCVSPYFPGKKYGPLLVIPCT